ncbi:MAG: ABC transporter substrate-binding protein [Candidatus Lambdaproteobacteria bacterium]|nr:ABC transporter substrate-binding protein [Candidatus Lambdaproteobacteria bacterium]
MKRSAGCTATALALAAMVTWPALGQAQEPIRIGAPFELTGRFAAYGTAGKRGVEMAVDAYGKRVLGRPIEVKYVDVQSNAQVTVSAMTELLEQERVDYVIGPITSGVVSWATPPWRQRKPVWLVPGSSSTRNETELGKEKYFFHPYPWDYDYHASLTAMLKHYIGTGKKLAIVYSDGAYGRAHLPHAKEAFAGAGYRIVLEELVREGAADYSPALLKVRQARPDLLLGLVQTADAILLTKQAKSANVGVPYLVGTVYAALNEWQKATGAAGDGWLSVTSYMPNLKRPGNPKYPKLFPSSDDWEKAFRARYNREPEFLDPLNYVAAVMLFMAIDRAGSIEKDKVVAELEKMDEPTFYGRAKYTKSKGGTLHQAFSAMIVMQRQNGKSVVIYPPEVAKGKLITAGP